MHDRWFSLEIVLGWTIRKNWMEYFEQNRTIEVDSLYDGYISIG